MKIEKREIAVRDIWNGYKNNIDDGSVKGYKGKLNIRPPYQREFVYKINQQQEVMNTVMNGFPLNVMYWAVTPDGYEVLDGQQRTLSIMSFLNHDYSINYLNKTFYIDGLTEEEKNKILDYKLDVYICDGEDREKLEWFRVVNIAGEKLYEQELRNSVYAGSWLTEAKRYFSKTGGVAYQKGHEFVDGVPNRQDYLETVLKWITQKDGKQIEDYMSLHQSDKDSQELEDYYEAVIGWASDLFSQKFARKKTLNWGELYEKYHHNNYDKEDIERRFYELMADDEVQRKIGVYEYLLSGEEKHLNLRTFNQDDKETAYYKAGGKCEKCHKEITLEEAQADHKIPWSKGGKTVPENLQILCQECNLEKSDKYI